MKKTTTLLLAGAVAALTVACGDGAGKKSAPMKIDNSLTEAEKSAGILTPEVMWKMGRVGGSVVSPDGETVLYTVSDYSMKDDNSSTHIWSVPTAGGEAVQITDGAGKESSIQWGDDGSRIYFLSTRSGEAQLWSAAPDGSDLRQLSAIEGGIEGYGLSPKGDKVYYIKRVQVEKRKSSEVFPDLPDSKALIYDDLMARHWDYWDDGSYLHLFVAEMKDGRMAEGVDIMPGEPWDAPMAPYFDAAEIAWNNAGTQLAYTCKKMKGKQYALSTNSDIYIYDLTAGTTVNITEGMMGYDKYPRFSPDDSMVAFTSMERDGNESDKDRLFIAVLATGEKKYLTKDFDYNAGNVTWDGNDKLWFLSPIRATYQLCKVGTDGSQVEVVTSGAHDLNAFTMGGGKLVAELMTLSTPSELFAVNLTDGMLSQLTNTNKEIYDNIRMGEVRERWVKTTDGKQMLTWVILPPDFDSTKTYPVLLYCQGGPQSVVSQRWSFRWNFQLMAAQGYIVVAPNRRGLPSFGQEWLDQISGDYSGQNIRDYLSAIDDVAREPWADETRMGCVGASYGGYSVYFLAGNHQKRFKAFIAHCGMFNFESMYCGTEELWFPNNDLGGSYWSDSPVAKRSYANSPHKFVKNWDTPILIFSGLNDFRIPYTENLQAYTAAQLMGVPARLVAFENEAHQVFKPQNSLVWQREFFGWLDKYVKNPQQETASAAKQ